jgi:hypothetical protein
MALLEHYSFVARQVSSLTYISCIQYPASIAIASQSYFLASEKLSVEPSQVRETVSKPEK